MIMLSRFYALAAAAAAAASMSGCVTHKSLYHVEVCLTGDEQEDEFLGFMRSVAQASGLEFVDGSNTYARRSVAMGLPSAADSTIYFGAESGVDSGGFTGGNLGLNRFQVGLAMTPTQDPSFNARVIERTTDEIIERWTARRLPGDTAFKPRAGCGDSLGPL